MGFWAELRLHPNQTEWILSRVKRNECLQYEQDLRTNPWCAHDLFVSKARPSASLKLPAVHVCSAEECRERGELQKSSKKACRWVLHCQDKLAAHVSAAQPTICSADTTVNIPGRAPQAGTCQAGLKCHAAARRTLERPGRT